MYRIQFLSSEGTWGCPECGVTTLDCDCDGESFEELRVERAREVRERSNIGLAHRIVDDRGNPVAQYRDGRLELHLSEAKVETKEELVIWWRWEDDDIWETDGDVRETLQESLQFLYNNYDDGATYEVRDRIGHAVVWAGSVQAAGFELELGVDDVSPESPQPGESLADFLERKSA